MVRPLGSDGRRRLFFIITILLISITLHFINSTKSFNHNLVEKNDNKATAGICVIVGSDEGPYIDEWLEYNIALGFNQIYLYDNTDNHMFGNWTTNREKVTIMHRPGFGMQIRVYNECAKQAIEDGHIWAAFIDVDEFIVLKKHRHIVQFLTEYCDSGAIILSWLIFGNSNHTEYEPIPVTKRFQYYVPDDEVNHFVNSIVRLEDFKSIRVPHWAFLRNHTTSRTTGGLVFTYPLLKPIHLWKEEERQSDVAVVHHYTYKSKNEYVKKRARGRSDGPWFDKCQCRQNGEEACRKCYEALVKKATEDAMNRPIPAGTVYDDSAWLFLKKNVPKYRAYDIDDRPTLLEVMKVPLFMCAAITSFMTILIQREKIRMYSNYILPGILVICIPVIFLKAGIFIGEKISTWIMILSER